MDLDVESMSSNRSAGSNADATSINSEEMATFLADVTMKHNPNSTLNGDSLLDDTDDEDNASNVDSSGKHKSKAIKREKEVKADDDSGLENGVQLSDN